MNKNMKFEDALKKLEEIVERMENGDVDLDKSLALFEEGVKLVRYCSDKLDEAKRKVEVLVKKGGTMVTAPFEPEEIRESTGVPGEEDTDLSR